ncbi:MAG: hypothetical protein LBH66_09215 [Oscillospiraceae bacterium]|jgi:uncharacterized membrane protein YkvI|nr:hypothetical protein [Oscillospiraceae bacterium]
MTKRFNRGGPPGETQTALAILATVIGAGFASGREVMVFFTRFGAWSWLGVAAAAAAFGLLTFGVMRLGGALGAGSFAELCSRALGDSAGRVCSALYAVMMLVTAGAMASGVGEIAALSMTVPRAYELGLAAAVIMGTVWARRGVGALAAGGGFLLPICGLLYIALAWRGRSLSGLIPSEPAASGLAAIPLAVGYACLNVTLGCGVLCEAARGSSAGYQGRVALWFTPMIGGLLAAANGALLPHAARVGHAALPMLALARGSTAAALLASASMLMAMMTTLIAMLRSMAGMIKAPEWVGYPAAAILTAACGLIGFNRIIGAAYPMMGWASAIALLVILASGKRRATRQ